MSPRSTPDALTRARKLLQKMTATEGEIVVLLSDDGLSKPDRAWILASLVEHSARFDSTLRTFTGMAGEPTA